MNIGDLAALVNLERVQGERLRALRRACRDVFASGGRPETIERLREVCDEYDAPWDSPAELPRLLRELAMRIETLRPDHRETLERMLDIEVRAQCDRASR